MTALSAQLAAELAPLIEAATDEVLADGGRYFGGTLSDLTRCRHGEIGEYEHAPDGQLVEWLWLHRYDYLTRLEEAAKPALTADTIVQVNAFLTHMAEHYRERTRLRRFGITFRQMSREDAMTLALATFDASQDMTGVAFGDPEYAWDRDHARELVDENLRHWEPR